MISDYQILDFLANNHADFKGKTVFQDIFTVKHYAKDDYNLEELMFDCYDHSQEGTAWILVYEKNNTLKIWESDEDMDDCWLILVDAKTLYSKRVAPQQALNRPECSLCMSDDRMMYACDDVYIPCPSCSR
jgi:hypothetical protein